MPKKELRVRVAVLSSRILMACGLVLKFEMIYALFNTQSNALKQMANANGACQFIAVYVKIVRWMIMTVRLSFRQPRWDPETDKGSLGLRLVKKFEL